MKAIPGWSVQQQAAIKNGSEYSEAEKSVFAGKLTGQAVDSCRGEKRMIEPVKPGDDLFPFNVSYADDSEIVVTDRTDWTTTMQIDLDLRTLDYLLQFEKYRRSVAVIRMIDAYEAMIDEHGSPTQKQRFGRYLTLRDAWLREGRTRT